MNCLPLLDITIKHKSRLLFVALLLLQGLAIVLVLLAHVELVWKVLLTGLVALSLVQWVYSYRFSRKPFDIRRLRFDGVGWSLIFFGDREVVAHLIGQQVLFFGFVLSWKDLSGKRITAVLLQDQLSIRDYRALKVCLRLKGCAPLLKHNLKK